MTKVYIIESELGWGSNVVEEMEFDTPKEADIYCRDYNTKYNSHSHAPDWYMYAKMEGQGYGMLVW